MTKEQELADRLKQHFSGPMTKEQVAIVRDMQAFLGFCLENGLSAQVAWGTLAHDVNGLLREENGFRPKVAGYTGIRQRLRDSRENAEEQRVSNDDESWE